MFRRHREDRRAARTNEEWAATTPPNESKMKRLGRFVIQWIKVSWLDIIILVLLLVASQLIYTTPLAATRTFPITFNGSGDIVYPDFAYPNRGWIISSSESALIAVFVPIAVILLGQIRIRSFWDLNNAVLGVLYSVILGTLFQVVIKQLIGGFRPYFLSVCQPDLSRVYGSGGHNTTGLNAVGFQQLMFSVDVCTNPDKSELKNAMTSFPSGHSTAAFAGFVFLFLWMNAKLKVWSNHRTSLHWLALLMAPLLGAALQVCALTIDQAHHWYDILAGSLIGTGMAFASYRVMYAAVFDWRWNHIPLKKNRVVEYMWERDGGASMQKAVFIRKLGWGRPKRVRMRTGKTTGTAAEKGVARGPGSARSSATYAQNARRMSPNGHGAVRYPEATTARGGPVRQPVGDDIV